MGASSRIAVLGLYNSGSTAVAGALHRLGVNMGPPFWAVSDEGADGNFYEPYDLAWHLRRWWNEPHGTSQTPADERIRFLKNWAALQEGASPRPLGAKHPLLSLSADDLLTAWGPQTRFVWCWRPLPESVAALQRRGWFGPLAAPLQTRLWEQLNEFSSRHPGVLRLEWARTQADPQAAVRELATVAGIEPSVAQHQAAAAFIRPAPLRHPTTAGA